MRPISLPVDVTNYVMLGLGQPLHAFDLDTLEAPIVVRRARPGERLTTLDDVERALDPGDLLITDRGGERAVADRRRHGRRRDRGRRRDPRRPHRGRALRAGVRSPAPPAGTSCRREASRRFERGVDPALAAAAAQLAVDLLVEHGGGRRRPRRHRRRHAGRPAAR